jgi:hypothetical protein
VYFLRDILVIIFSFSVVDVMSSLPTTNLMKSNKSVSPFLYIAPHISITVGVIINDWKVTSGLYGDVSFNSSAVHLFFFFLPFGFLKHFFIYNFGSVQAKSAKLVIYGECMEPAGLFLYLLTVPFIVTSILSGAIMFVSHHKLVNILGKFFKNISKCPHLSTYVCLNMCVSMTVSTICGLQSTSLINPNNWAVKMNVHTLFYRVITSLWIMRVSRKNLEYSIAILYAVFEIVTVSNILSNA